eukprot:357924-Chlamydomonas_euryale.AAC.2
MLKADHRHQLVDALSEEPTFACLFSYAPGVGVTQSAAAAATSMPSPQHLQKLTSLREKIQAQPARQLLRALDLNACDQATAPSTSAATPASATLTVTVTPEYSTADVGPGRVRFVVSLKAVAETHSRANVALSSVLDVSGSMSGQRLDLVKETSHFLIDKVT